MNEPSEIDLGKLRKTDLIDGWYLYDEPDGDYRVGYIGRDLPDTGPVVFRVLQVGGSIYLGAPMTRKCVTVETCTEAQTKLIKTLPSISVMQHLDAFWTNDGTEPSMRS